MKAVHDPQQAVKLHAQVGSRPDKSGAELHPQVSWSVFMQWSKRGTTHFAEVPAVRMPVTKHPSTW